MTANSQRKVFSLTNLYRLFLGMGVIENSLICWYLLSLPTKTERAFLIGYSLKHLSAGSAILLGIGLYIFLFYDSFKSCKFLKILTARLQGIIKNDTVHFIIRISLIITSVSSLLSLVFCFLPEFQRLAFFFPYSYLFSDFEALEKIFDRLVIPDKYESLDSGYPFKRQP